MDADERPGLQDEPMTRVGQILERAKTEDRPEWLTCRVIDFTNICDLGQEILWDRGEAYGDATAECGLLGAAITLTTDVARIRRLLLDLNHLQRLQEGDRELRQKLEDALIDAHNYAGIALHWLREGNLMGRPNYE